MLVSPSSKMKTFSRPKPRFLSRRRLIPNCKRNTRKSILLTIKCPDGQREFMASLLLSMIAQHFLRPQTIW